MKQRPQVLAPVQKDVQTRLPGRRPWTCLAQNYLLPLLLATLVLVLGGPVMAEPDGPADQEVKEQKDTSKAGKKEAGKKEAGKKETGKKEADKKDSEAKNASRKKPKESSEEDATKKQRSPTPPHATAKKAPMRVEVSLDGTFEAKEMADISVQPDSWSTLTVLKAVEHGERVKRGDLLVSLDLEKIDEAIADLRTELRLSELTFREATEELRTLEAVTPLNLETLDRAKRIAKEDFERFFEVELPMSKKTTKFSLEMSKKRLDYVKEELRQLEKMYKADDLTEETEEIILQRARDSVEQAEFQLELAKLRHDRALELSLPRQEEEVKDENQRRKLAFREARAVLSLSLAKKKLEMEKLKIERARSEDKLEKLLADRAAMTVKSPIDGVVYYGQCVSGKWSGATTAATKLRPGGKLSANEVFMTVVQPRPLRVVASVPEEALHDVRAGQKGTLEPAGYPDLKLSGILDEVVSVPGSGNTFLARFTLALDKEENLMPGMTCTVKLIPYQKKDALVLPPATVHEEPLDENKHFVYLLKKDGKHEKRPVMVGRKNAKQVEILKGLAPGDKVLLECPDENGKDKE